MDSKFRSAVLGSKTTHDPSASIMNAIDAVSSRDFPADDPRTFDGSRMRNHQLPKPMHAASTKDVNKKYNQGYTSLRAIDKGHISYYCGEVGSHIFNPITHTSGTVFRDVFVNPNGISSPMFDIDQERLSREAMDRKQESALSFINDTSLHRQDIMARNLSVYNRQRFDTSFC